eukprot:8652101-Lingulodinium_polyedra.AAC.1
MQFIDARLEPFQAHIKWLSLHELAGYRERTRVRFRPPCEDSAALRFEWYTYVDSVVKHTSAE